MQHIDEMCAYFCLMQLGCRPYALLLLYLFYFISLSLMLVLLLKAGRFQAV